VRISCQTSDASASRAKPSPNSASRWFGLIREVLDWLDKYQPVPGGS
jgi:hypothetical protein